MNNILVLYPKEFGSYDKFKRKLLQLTKNMERFNLFYPSKIGDTNQFCKRFNYDVEKSILCNEIDDWKSSTITHAIIFDDGEEFVVEKLFFSSIEKPFRVIKIKITRVININRCTQYQGVKSTNDFEYIGRGSYWGNPHSMYDNNMDDDRDDRDEVIRKYKYDFDYDKFPNKKGYKDKSVELSGKKLGCFCKPYACHGDVIADYLNSLDDGL
jgi:hypothetical protein